MVIKANKSIVLCKILSLALVFALLAASSAYGAEEIVEIKSTNTEIDYGTTIRVLLSRLQLTKYFDLELIGAYSVQSQNGTEILFNPGTLLNIRLNEHGFVVYYNNMTWYAGESLRLSRQNIDGAVKINGNDALYEGDFVINSNEDKIYAVLYIPVERYLLGVVPYEMSNDFPIEALKAQAIAARTYAIKHLNPSDTYDLVDTTKDQVFKGMYSDKTNTIKAIEGTSGLIGVVDGQLASCYYSGSNGGQTELPSNIWGGSGDSNCYQITDDPFDLANPESMEKSYTLLKNINSNSHQDAQNLICTYLIPFSMSFGFDTAPENIRLDKINSVKLKNPKFDEPSRVYTEIEIDLNFSGRKKEDMPSLQNNDNNINIVDVDSDIALFNSEETQAVVTAEPTIIPLPTDTPEPTVVPTLPPFVEAPAGVTVTIPVYPDLMQAFGLELHGGGNELLTVEENSDSFIITSRRYGHGAGMSQRGAQQMANEGKDFLFIINFYYPGMQIVNYKELGSIPTLQPLRTTAPFLQGTVEPLPTTTPIPTPRPLTLQMPENAQIVIVNKIEENSFLNLREQPGLNYGVLQRLYFGQELYFVEETDIEGWIKVQLNGENPDDIIEGYIMLDFVQFKQ